MASLGIHFEQDSKHPIQRESQTSKMGRTKSLQAFLPQEDMTSNATHGSRYSDPSYRVDISNTRPETSTRDDQAQGAGYESYAYIPTTHARHTLVTADFPSEIVKDKRTAPAALPKSKTTSVTPHTSLDSASDHLPGPTASNECAVSDYARQPADGQYVHAHNTVHPGALFMRRWESTKERVDQKHERNSDQSFQQPLTIHDYLGAGMMAAAQGIVQGPPSLDLLRAIVLNSPRTHSSDSNELSPLTPSSSTFQTRAPGSSRLPAFLQNQQYISSRDRLSPITPHSGVAPNSPSRLPAFLQKGRSSREGLTPVNVSPHALASVPSSPLNPQRADIPLHAGISLGLDLQLPPTDRNMMERSKSAVDAPRNSTRHRTMKSMNDIQSLYNFQQCYPPYSQHQRNQYPPSVSGTLGPESLTQTELDRINLTPRSWRVENLFDCPDLTYVPDAGKSSKGANDSHQTSGHPIIEVTKLAVQPTTDLRDADVEASHRPSRSRREAEPRKMQRSQSEGSVLKLASSLTRKSTLMTVGGDSVKRSRDLSRILAPSARNVNDDHHEDDEPKSVRGSRPSTACSNYTREHERSPRKVEVDAESTVVALEGSKPARKARVELDLLLESSLIVEGGKLTGRIEVRVPHHNANFGKKNSKEVWFGEPKIRIIGFEELSTGDARHVFYHHPVDVPMNNQNESKKIRATENLLAIKDDPIDEEGFRQARGGVHFFPFQIRLPVGQGAKGSWKGKQGTVRYIVLGSIKLKSRWGGDRSIAHFYRHVEFYPYFDPIKTLAPSPQCLIAKTSKALFMGGQGKVHLTAKLHRSIWVAGQRCYVDVRVSNDGSKKIKTLTLALIRSTIVFRSKAPSSDSDAECQTMGDGSKHPDFCSTQTTKKKVAESVLVMGKKGHQGLVTAKGLWMGVDQGEEVGFSHFLTIPSEALTITRGRRLEVAYTIKVSVGGSLSSDVTVDIPIKVINFVSIDPPPGHATLSTQVNGLIEAQPLVRGHSFPEQDVSSKSYEKEDSILRGGQDHSRGDRLGPRIHGTSDQEELDFFMSSSRFPEEGLPQTFDQIIGCPKLHQRRKSEGIFLDSVPRGHKPQRHQSAGSTGILADFPLPPPSRVAFEELRSDAKPSSNRMVHRPGHKRGSSQSRFIGGRYPNQLAEHANAV